MTIGNSHNSPIPNELTFEQQMELIAYNKVYDMQKHYSTLIYRSRVAAITLIGIIAAFLLSLEGEELTKKYLRINEGAVIHIPVIVCIFSVFGMVFIHRMVNTYWIRFYYVAVSRIYLEADMKNLNYFFYLGGFRDIPFIILFILSYSSLALFYIYLAIEENFIQNNLIACGILIGMIGAMFHSIYRIFISRIQVKEELDIAFRKVSKKLGDYPRNSDKFKLSCIDRAVNRFDKYLKRTFSKLCESFFT